jgi:hypothetical protein
MGTRRKLTTALAAGTLALAALGGCGGDDETTSVPAPDGTTGPAGEAAKDSEKPASEANQEGAGSGLEQAISGSDSEGTDTESGQQGTIGDTTAE